MSVSLVNESVNSVEIVYKNVTTDILFFKGLNEVKTEICNFNFLINIHFMK